MLHGPPQTDLIDIIPPSLAVMPADGGTTNLPRRLHGILPAPSAYPTQEDPLRSGFVLTGRVPQPQGAPPPGPLEGAPPGAAACVMGACTIETLDQDSKGHLGCEAYRMRSTEAIGKHWCLVFVAYSLLHLTCLPTVPDRTKHLIQSIGDACRHQGRAVLQKLLGFVHDQLSHGATVDHVFAQLFAKQRGMAPV